MLADAALSYISVASLTRRTRYGDRLDLITPFTTERCTRFPIPTTKRRLSRPCFACTKTDLYPYQIFQASFDTIVSESEVAISQVRARAGSQGQTNRVVRIARNTITSMSGLDHWLTLVMRLSVAMAVGLGLGLEREWRGHDAGLRTHALIALSSAAITLSALMIAADQPVDRDSDPLRAVQGIAQAVGLIAGGLIFVRGGDVRNMTTAASLWVSAAAGIAAGAGQYRLTAGLALATLIVLSLVGVVERSLSRRMNAHTPAPPDCE